MAEIKADDGKYSLVLSDQEYRALELNTGKEYEISRAKKGIYVLLEKGDAKKPLPQAPAANETDKKIFELMGKKSLSERVEGKFEKFLSQKELARFNELLAAGTIEKFKLSDKYKKPVYKISWRKINGSAQQKQGQEINEINSPKTISGSYLPKPASNYSSKSAPMPAQKAPVPGKSSLGTGGFMIFKKEDEARKFSGEHFDEMKSGAIKGLKSFDGTVYMVEKSILNACEQRLRDYLRGKKNISLDDLVKDTAMQRELAKAACEFMKEDGDLMEKKKEIYSYIE